MANHPIPRIFPPDIPQRFGSPAIGLTRLFAFSRTCVDKMANGDRTERCQIYSLLLRELAYAFSILTYYVLCELEERLRTGYGAPTMPVKLHTWFWVSIPSPCSIMYGLTQIATLNIFCHVTALHFMNHTGTTLISSTMEIHIPDITIPRRHITHQKENGLLIWAAARSSGYPLISMLKIYLSFVSIGVLLINCVRGLRDARIHHDCH